MALSIRERPQGVILKPCISATIDQDYTGFATVNTVTPHGIANNDFVYVTSAVEDYNGFWQVHFIDGYHLFLLNPDGTYVAYIIDSDITLCAQSSLHGWSCVHLPIVYRIYSSLFPSFVADSGTVITSSSNTNGYTTIHVFVSDVDDLEYIELIGTGPLAGIYQALEVIPSPFSFVINHLYDATEDFTVYKARKYYSNYHVLVNVWAGLNTSHHWASRKPYELAATLKFIPDSNNECLFSISEILKSYITIQNNLIQATLPNSLESFVQFYIETAESYDNSNGYTITTFESSFTSDKSNLEGYAANSILDFKNQFSGFLSDYIADKGGKFLTLFDQPTIFEGLYFDIGFILNFNSSPLYLKQDLLDENGTIQVTSTSTITNYSAGVYRIPLTAQCNYNGIIESTYLNSQFLTTIDGWTQPNAGSTTDDWAWSSTNVILRKQESQDALAKIEHSISFNTGDQIRIRTAFGGNNIDNYDLKVYAIESSIPVSHALATFSLVSGIEKQVDSIVTIPAGSFGTAYNTIGFTIEGGDNSGNTVFVRTFKVTSPPTAFVGTIKQMQLTVLNNASVAVSEVKLLNIDCSCSNQSKYISWMNQFGTMEYWNFTGWSEYPIIINDTGESKKNVFQNWPRSYGSDANTINRQTFRTSIKQVVIRSQHLTLDQLTAIEYIKSSLVVEIFTSRYDKRRIIIDKDSFVTHKDNDKLFEISFTATYTDNIAAQKQ